MAMQRIPYREFKATITPVSNYGVICAASFDMQSNYAIKITA